MKTLMVPPNNLGHDLNGKPVNETYSIKLTGEGWLLLHTAEGQKNITSQTHSATSASMLDSGNFVLYNHFHVTWESFAYPYDTLLGGQKLSARDQLNSQRTYKILIKKQSNSSLPCHSQSRGNGKFLGCYKKFTEEEVCSQRGLKLSYNITAVENVELGVYPYSVLKISKEGCRKLCMDDCNCWASIYADDHSKMLEVLIVYAWLNKNVSATVFIKISFPKVYKDPNKPPRVLVMEDKGVVTERKRLTSILSITLGFLALVCTLIAFFSFFFYRVHARRKKAIAVKRLEKILCCTSDMEIDMSSNDKIPLCTWVYHCFVTKELNRLIRDKDVDANAYEKMVKVGHLCVQDDPEARPSIKDVILMLEGTIGGFVAKCEELMPIKGWSVCCS
ncbi:S-locus glycoprotein domain-containing protein [Tanacetum coccineum]